ncbi:unnamed protein product [Arabis nemorensis]|uniref:Uncharacterized protein n=1 Tax=Arabis nemorensis TaxID=586526 RepID=A0A565AL94_9BRAS|nr:unnamed protein product [Arabis nemorensis]
MEFDNLTDQSIVFRKLKAISENKCEESDMGIDHLRDFSLHRLFICPSKSQVFISASSASSDIYDYAHKSDIIISIDQIAFSNGSTSLDSWRPEQLMAMMFGGNNRAQVFFKQHGWIDGSNYYIFEAKYTSRAAYLYRQVLANEVAKAMAEETTTGLPSSPLATSEPFEESDDARKLFPNAKSISSAQFPGSCDLESKDKSLVQKLGTLASAIFGGHRQCSSTTKESSERLAIYALRREVTDLMQRFRSQDADALPFTTCSDWIAQVLDRRARAIVGVKRDPHLQTMLEILCRDLIDLSDETKIGLMEHHYQAQRHNMQRGNIPTFQDSETMAK